MALFSIGTWRPKHLVRSWIAYWLGALAIALGPAILAASKASEAPDGAANISAGFENGLLHATINVLGTTTWSGAASIGALAFWFAGPPLILWGIWMSRSARLRELEGADARAIGEGAAESVVGREREGARERAPDRARDTFPS